MSLYRRCGFFLFQKVSPPIKERIALTLYMGIILITWPVISLSTPTL